MDFLRVTSLLWVLYVALVGLEVFAFVDALTRQAPAFVAADKQTKQFWLLLLGLGALATLYFGPLSPFLIGLIGVVAAAVYILDVRPAVRSLGGGRGDNRKNMGPYGPW